jgi:hypothetical protein
MHRRRPPGADFDVEGMHMGEGQAPHVGEVVFVKGAHIEVANMMEEVRRSIENLHRSLPQSAELFIVGIFECDAVEKTSLGAVHAGARHERPAVEVRR